MGGMVAEHSPPTAYRQPLTRAPGYANACSPMYASPSALPRPTTTAPSSVRKSLPARMTSSVTSVPSFIPPPVPAAPQVTVPAPVYQTEGLTEGLIEPRQIEADKAAYLQNVNVQLNLQIEAAEREANIKKQML